MLEAADGEEALEIVRMPMASIDLLLLDVVLPDMDGIACTWKYPPAGPARRSSRTRRGGLQSPSACLFH